MRFRPLVSVVMPVFNASGFLAEAVGSILAQSLSDLELIVVDDGSTDGSVQIVEELARADGRIHLHRLAAGADPGGGAGRAANHGIRAAAGCYIARMDADDIALPDRLARQIAWLEADKLDICGSQARVLGDGGSVMWFPEREAALRHELVFRVGILQPTMVARRDVHLSLPYDERIAWEDYAFETSATWRYRMGNCRDILLLHRRHAGQISRRREHAFMRDYRVFALPYIKKLLPDITPRGLASVFKIVSRRAAVDPSELDEIGGLLARLSDLPDDHLRRRMRRRWLEHCAVCAGAGLAVDAIRDRYAAAFRTDPDHG
jgi:glycosyltransferase involved in cell wall biosynthesis